MRAVGPGAFGIRGVRDSLRSSTESGRFTIDALLRYVGPPSPATAAQTELGARFAYRASDSLEIPATGANLLDERHVEYAAPAGHEPRRAIYAGARLPF